MFAFTPLTDLYRQVIPAIALLLVGAVIATLLGAFVPPGGEKARRRMIVWLLVSLLPITLLYLSPPIFANTWRRFAEPRLQPELSVKLEGRVHGDGQWRDWRRVLVAKPGDKVDLLLSYENTGMGQADNVVVRIDGAPGLIPQPWTSYFYNSKYPGGLPALGGGSEDGTNLFVRGWNLGSYSSGANGYASIVVRVPKKKPTSGSRRTSIENDGLVTYAPVCVVK